LRTNPATGAATDHGFQQWLKEFGQEAQHGGISPQTVAQAFAEVRFNTEVIERDRRQPEFSRPVWEYLASAVSATRIERGRALLERHRGLLDDIARRYGVQPRYLVAIWGLETNYGRTLGEFNVFEALATLAYDGRRKAFARAELLAALSIVQTEGLEASELKGSWAGAIGQTQFIPSTYQRHAVDYDGDGTRDLRSSLPDALASTAQYLAVSGWRAGEPWGMEVQVPANFPWELSGAQVRKPLTDWQGLGVHPVRGEVAKNGPDQAALIAPAGHLGPTFLTLPNFRAVLRYNASTSYALAAGLLADRINGAADLVATWPDHLRPLSRTEKQDLQRLLTQHGYDTGGVDGLIGPRTRAALRAYQQDAGHPSDGYPTAELLDELRRR